MNEHKDENKNFSEIEITMKSILTKLQKAKGLLISFQIVNPIRPGISSKHYIN